MTDHVSRTPRSLSGPENCGSSRRVLVADDDASVRRALQRCLGERFDLLVARDGEEALRLARRHRPAVAVLDLTLPKVSGIAVAWTLRNDPRYEAIPAVLVGSADEPPDDPASPDDRDIWAESLAAALLQRPLDPERLVALVSRLAAPHAPAAPPHDAGDERRLMPRVPVSIPAKVATHSREAEGIVLSLSPRGAFVQSEVLFDPGARAALSFDDGRGGFTGECEVLYRSEESCRGMGLMFHGLTPGNESRLLRALGA